MTDQISNDMQRAGTGFMESVSDALKYFEGLGYDKNIVPRYDHFEVDCGAKKIFPDDFEVDEIFRFENTSDPDDQAVVYAISSRAHNLKGVFMESYGIQQESFSKAMIDRLKKHAH
jgi:hypothetical protein